MRVSYKKHSVNIFSAIIFNYTRSFTLTKNSSCGAIRLPTLPQKPQWPMATPLNTVGNSSDAYRNIVQKPLTTTPLPIRANAV